MVTLSANSTTVRRSSMFNSRRTFLAALLALFSITSLGYSSPVEARDFRSFLNCLRTPIAHFDGTIVDAAVATDDLSTLVFAVDAAGLVDTLNSDGPFTVFAPTNAAFAAIPEDVLNVLLADPSGALTDVLTYHVLSAKIDPRYYYYPRRLPTAAGQSIFINRTRGDLRVNNSSISCQGVRTSNGIVWIIDSVLLPQFQQ